MILIQQWITWAGNKRAEDFLSQSFPTVSMKTRKFLLESEDFDLVRALFFYAVMYIILTNSNLCILLECKNVSECCEF